MLTCIRTYAHTQMHTNIHTYAHKYLSSVFATLVYLHEFWDFQSNISVTFTNPWSCVSWMNDMPVDSKFIPWLALFQAAWGTTFLALWQSKENEILFGWNESIHLELESLSRFGFTSKHTESHLVKPKVELQIRAFVSYTVTVAFLLGAGVSIFLTFMWEEHLSGLEWMVDEFMLFEMTFPIKSMVPLVVRALLPFIATPLGTLIFDFCTKLEFQPKLKYEENSLIVKKFLFAFVLNFSAMFYIALVKKDLVELRSYLIFILIFGQIINNLSEWWSGEKGRILHFIRQRFFGYKDDDNITAKQLLLKKVHIHKHILIHILMHILIHILVLILNLICIEILILYLDLSLYSCSHSNTMTVGTKELVLEEANIDDEFLEMAIQFGLVTMFAVAFPLTPLFCFANNLLEGTVDIVKLSGAKRYSSQVNRARIGVWQDIFEFTGFVAVLINTYLLCFSCENFSEILPADFDHDIWLSFSGRFMVMVGLEHLLLGLKYALRLILYDDAVATATSKQAEGFSHRYAPGGVTGVTRPSMVMSGANADASTPYTPMSSSASSSSSSSSSAAAALSINTPSQAHQQFNRKLPSTKQSDLTQARKPGHTGTPFFNDPILFLAAFLIAPLLHTIGMPMIWYSSPYIH